MIKRVFLFAAEFILFFVVYALGSLLPAAHVLPDWRVSTSPTSWVTIDGIVFMTMLYVILLIVAKLRWRVHVAWTHLTLAYVLALLLGLFAKLGFASLS